MFEDAKSVAAESGAMKQRARVFDSTPVYDAVATQDTVTQLRAVIRKLLVVLDNRAAREQLVDDLVHDCLARLGVLGGEELVGPAKEAADLLALVAGQDTEEGEDGVFRIMKKVAKDRVISTVDPEARHGHKSTARRFDGFKAHLSVDPDSELIDEVVVTPANTPDRDAVPGLVDSPDGESSRDRRRRRLWRRGNARRAARGRTHRRRSRPADAQRDRRLPQGPLPDRSRVLFGHLPHRQHRPDPPQAPRWCRELRPALWDLPARLVVHDLPLRQDDHDPSI